MGKNSTGGNKQKRQKNHTEKPKSVPITQITPDEETTFIGTVTKNLGNYRLNVDIYPTNTSHNTLIPGSFRKKVWIKTNDLVLIQISDLGEKQSYIIHKYEPREIEELIAINKYKLNNGSEIDDLFSNVEEAGTEAEISLDDL